MTEDDAAYLRKVGMRIKLYRLAAGLSQGDFARVAAVSRVTLGSIERGTHAASVLTYRALARALSRDMGALLSDGEVLP